MKTTQIPPKLALRILAILAVLGLSVPASRCFPIITNVVETGGDNEATDTVTAKWTGVTFINGIANEPRPGRAAGAPYTVGIFGATEPCYVDRAHCYTNAAPVAMPAYLAGGEYIMSGNDNRDNASYRLDVYVATPVHVYMLIDNRLSDANNANPPTFDATHMQWILDQGWTAVRTGVNRNSNASIPDEVAIDEDANGSINNWFSIYTKDFPAGTFTLRQADNAGQNMYGVVITGASPPGVPANLAAVGGDNKVSLTWTASGGAAGYIVKRSLIAGGPYDNIATNASPGYVDTAVVNGLTYYYVVTAFSPIGESANSNEATGQPNPAPIGVVATGGTNQVEVRWEALAGAASYTVKRSLTSGGPYSTVASGITDTNYLDIGASSGRLNYYVVIAQLLIGGDSGQSDQASALTAPAAPTSLAASVWAATAIRLTWTSTEPVVSQFLIERAVDGVNFMPEAAVAGNQRSFTNSGLALATAHTYRVRAENATGLSDYSNIAASTTPSFGLNVNFANAINGTPANNPAPTPPGYLQDVGDVYGDRGNGHSYGWDADNTVHSRWRLNTPAADLRYQTFNHLQKPLPAGRSWEIEIPNGFYQVHIAAGDVENFDSVFQHNIEGVITPTTFPDTATRIFEYTNTVIVDDGRLTISNGSLAQNSKINFVDVYPAPPATLPVIAAHPQPLTVEDRHAATFSVTLSSGSVPFRYQWLHDDTPIPGATGPTLTLSDVVMGDAGAYKVAVSNYAGAVTSDAATLTVVSDTNPPVVLKAVSLDGLTITLCFSEVLDRDSAQDTFSYISAGGINSAVLQADGRTVVLTLATPVTDTFTIELNNVVDRSGLGTGVVPVSGRVLGFVGEDINAPALLGSHYTCDGSTFVISGSGTNVAAGNADQFHFVSCSVQGNFEVRVRVADLSISNVFARAMLMVRESNVPGSRHATLSVTAPQPGRDLGEAIARGTANGNSGTWGANFSPAGIPVWLRITRAGNTLTGYRSTNGVNWTQAAQTTASPALPAALLVGMGVNSQDAATLATATFTDFRIDWLTPAPTIVNPVYNAGAFSGRFSSVAGLSYNIQYKDDLTSPSWTVLTTLPGTGSPVPFMDPGPPSSSGLRVYRVRLR